MTRLNPLDGLRGIAVIFVVMVHCAGLFPDSITNINEYAKIYGGYGVQLFFIISAFSMLMTYRVKNNYLKAFYIKRFLRIAPLFWVMLTISLLVKGLESYYWAPHGLSIVNVIKSFLFLGWLDPTSMNSIVPGAWSIYIEMQFYLIFPIFHWLLKIKKMKIIPYLMIWGISSLFLYIKTNYLYEYFGSQYLDSLYIVNAFFTFWLPNQLACFGYGFILYGIYEKKELHWIGFIMMAYLSIQNFGMNLLLIFIISLSFIMMNINISILNLIGKCSYSIYLIHYFLGEFIEYIFFKLDPSFKITFELGFFILLLMSASIAYFITRPYIEIPFINLGVKLNKKLESGL